MKPERLDSEKIVYRTARLAGRLVLASAAVVSASAIIISNALRGEHLPSMEPVQSEKDTYDLQLLEGAGAVDVNTFFEN